MNIMNKINSGFIRGENKLKKIVSIILVYVVLITSVAYAQGRVKPAAATKKNTKKITVKKIVNKKPNSKTTPKLTTKAVHPKAVKQTQKIVKQTKAPKTPASTASKPKDTAATVVQKADNMFGISAIEFSAKGLDGIKHSSKNIFSQNKLTMINFWGTLCTPCIKELPELQELNDQMSSEKFGVIGIVGDVCDDDTKAEAKDIIAKKGIDFVNLIPNEEIQKDLLSKISGYPVSVFVDSNGNIVGDIIVGARSKEEYKSAAEKILGTLK